MSPENFELVEIWKVFKVLGPWAIPALGISMSPQDAHEAVWLLYELELANEALRREYTSENGSGVRLAWDTK